MENHIIVLSCNGWEYRSLVRIKCKSIIQKDKKTIIADGIEIKFDEECVMGNEEDFDDFNAW